MSSYWSSHQNSIWAGHYFQAIALHIRLQLIKSQKLCGHYVWAYSKTLFPFLALQFYHTPFLLEICMYQTREREDFITCTHTLVSTRGPELVSLPMAGLYLAFSPFRCGRCLAFSARNSCITREQRFQSKNRKVGLIQDNWNVATRLNRTPASGWFIPEVDQFNFWRTIEGSHTEKLARILFHWSMPLTSAVPVRKMTKRRLVERNLWAETRDRKRWNSEIVASSEIGG